jgi:putative transposase
VAQLAEQEGVSGACRLLAVPRSRYYRMRRPAVTVTTVAETVAEMNEAPQPGKSGRALNAAEKSKVRDLLNSVPYQDRSPRQVYAALLDQGEYLCSWRTMYRILHEHGEVKERRNQLRRPVLLSLWLCRSAAVTFGLLDAGAPERLGEVFVVI